MTASAVWQPIGLRKPCSLPFRRLCKVDSTLKKLKAQREREREQMGSPLHHSHPFLVTVFLHNSEIYMICLLREEINMRCTVSTVGAHWSSMIQLSHTSNSRILTNIVTVLASLKRSSPYYYRTDRATYQDLAQLHAHSSPRRGDTWPAMTPQSPSPPWHTPSLWPPSPRRRLLH